MRVGAPAAAILTAVYKDWISGSLPNETAKTLTQLAVGAALGGAIISMGFSAGIAIITYGIAGYYIDKYWDAGIDKLSDGFAFIFNQFPSLMLGVDKITSTLQSSLNTAETVRSPLILDLDGDGVETTDTKKAPVLYRSFYMVGD